jgi:glycosyltransferase involved in cell wall biosynthesis
MKRKVTILLPDLRGGGAERLAVLLANAWTEQGHDVSLLLLRNKGEFSPLLSPAISVVDLGLDRMRHAIIPLAKYLKRARPDILWVGMWPLTSVAVVGWLWSGRIGKLFLTEHIPLSISARRELNVSSLLIRFTIKLTYPMASGVMAVSNGVAEDLVRLSGLKSETIKVIYNPACRDRFPEKSCRSQTEHLWRGRESVRIISVGEFKLQKNHLLLIHAFSEVSKRLDSVLTILGEGELRPELEKAVTDLGLTARVSLPGFFLDPYPWLSSADLFVLSSDWEGLPTVLIEALECGLNIVSTDCPYGPSEILEFGKYGRLVKSGSIELLRDAILDSLSQQVEEKELRARAKDFSVSSISKRYIDYFETFNAKD